MFHPAREAITIVHLIDCLRADEGDCVTILCDNPDFNGQPDVAIECCGAWTEWQQKRFGGPTLVAALVTAEKAKRDNAKPMLETEH